MLRDVRIWLGLAAVALAMFVTPVAAEEKPIQLSLFAPVQLVSESDAIKGLRINLIYGKNTYMTGVDWGMVNHLTTGVSKGVQFGLVGIVEGDFVGWQDQFVNVTKGNFEGFQSGFFNSANHVEGVQFGIVNYARSMKGLQIGLINIIKQDGQFPVFPFVNWSF